MSGSDHLPKLSINSPTSSNSSSNQSLTQAGLTKQNNILNPSNSVTIPTTTISSQSIMNNNHRYVKFNVGGRLFTTSLDTLLKQDNMFRAMFSGRMDVCTDIDGYILIDRSGKHFEFILNYLRDEDTHQYLNQLLDDQINYQFNPILTQKSNFNSNLVSSSSRVFFSDFDLYELLKEAKFYCITPLVNLIEQKLKLIQQLTFMINQSNSNEPYFGSSIVSMVTSKSDLHKILNSTDKPCIRLLINRHNNKYSYTNSSDDNLLKNIELFERMAIKFKNRIMFIKDTASNEEICCWYFHGNGKKLSEVCCTSIVYTTEKKQTKVEFPDSKILEEIFVNAVLFETKEQSSNNSNISSVNFINNDGPSSNQYNDQDSNESTVTTPNLLEEQMPRLSIGSLHQHQHNGNQIVNSALNAVSSVINNINLAPSGSNSSNFSSPSTNNPQIHLNQTANQPSNPQPNSFGTGHHTNHQNVCHNNSNPTNSVNNNLISSTSSNLISIANSLANSARRTNSGANSSLR